MTNYYYEEIVLRLDYINSPERAWISCSNLGDKAHFGLEQTRDHHRYHNKRDCSYTLRVFLFCSVTH